MILSLQTCVKRITFPTHSQSILQQQSISSPCLLLMSDCKTLTALSRLFVSHRCNLGSLQGPQGQGTLNTDNMCGVSVANHPPLTG